VQQIAYQMVKYRQRNGRTHRDTLRQAHPVPASKAHNDLFKWAVSENDANAAFDQGEYRVAAELRTSVMMGYELAKRAKSPPEVVRLITEYGLDWEMIPTNWLTEKIIWQALIVKMKPWAMIRNLGRMTSLGVFQDKMYTNLVVNTLTDAGIIKRERLHPIRALVGHVGYKSGHGRAHGNKQLTWRPVPEILQALEAAMYLGFDAIQPSGKRVHFAMDISGSMGMGNVCGVDGLTPMMASAVMMMATLRAETDVYVSGFTTKFEPVNVTRQSTLPQVIKEMERLSRYMGSTDCAKPMLWSADQGRAFDAFVITTDNETWAGNVKPPEALRRYRQHFVPDARLVVVGMTATQFTIADPKDQLSLDVVGMSTDTPSIVSRFIAGEF
jgi:60 kDa SS-A/Ro ribonucleoprotein